MVEHKDVVLALLGASAGLAGLALVFLGLVVTNLASFAGGTKKEILDRYRRPGIAILVAFALGIAVVGVATWWLVLLHDDSTLYALTIGLFVAQLVCLVAATTWAVRRIMWG